MSSELINMCKYSMKTIGSLISGDFYYLYHYISGYVLLPIRLLLLFLNISLSFTCLLFVDYIESDKEYLSYKNKIIDISIRNIINIVGLNINIKNDKNYLDFIDKNQYDKTINYIVVFNHIHIYDSIVLYSLFNRIVSVLMVKHMAEKFPINIIFKMSKSISCDRDQRQNTVDKIKKHLFDRISPIVIAADSCGDLKENELICPFKTGAFAPEYPVLPVIIRYIPSSNKDMIWARDTDVSHILKTLIDGHLDVQLQVLDFERVNVEIKDNKTRINKFKDKVYEQMTNSLEKLPKMTPPRIETFIHNDPYYALIIMIFNILYSRKICSMVTLMMFISGYISNKYSTNNTNMVYYSILGYVFILNYFF